MRLTRHIPPEKVAYVDNFSYMAAEGCAEGLLQDRCIIEMMSATVLSDGGTLNFEMT